MDLFKFNKTWCTVPGQRDAAIQTRILGTRLLSRLDIAGAVITMDAMGCQKKIAEQIIQQGGDYVLSLKGNQGHLHEDVVTYFESSLSPEAAVITVDGDHGRIGLSRTICIGFCIHCNT